MPWRRRDASATDPDPGPDPDPETLLRAAAASAALCEPADERALGLNGDMPARQGKAVLADTVLRGAAPEPRRG